MFSSADEVLSFIKEQDVKFVDIRFCDLPGIMQHFNVPAESLDEDFRRSEKLMEELSQRGVQRWRCEIKSFGPFKYAITKEVGPPPWKFPKLLTKVVRTPWHVMIGCGWRSTAYTFHLFRGKKS